jgi:hypothetical protein
LIGIKSTGLGITQTVHIDHNNYQIIITFINKITQVTIRIKKELVYRFLLPEGNEPRLNSISYFTTSYDSGFISGNNRNWSSKKSVIKRCYNWFKDQLKKNLNLN